MSRITAIRQGSRGKQIKVFLDGKYAFGLEAEIAAGEGLRVGQELSDSQVENLLGSNSLQRCFDAAYRYLDYRPRSESEMRDRLHRRGFDRETIDKVLNRLKENGLVDDTAFAEFWKDNRQAFSPRSKRLMRLELAQKGIARDIAEQIVGTSDDADSAYRAALGKARILHETDYQGFRRRLGSYLRRRGFSYDVIDHTIERLWQEHGRKPDSTERANIAATRS